MIWKLIFQLLRDNKQLTFQNDYIMIDTEQMFWFSNDRKSLGQMEDSKDGIK